MDLIAALRRHPLISGSWGGFGPIEVLDMRANEKGTPNFAGVLNHHTVSGENSGKYPSKSICQNGRGGPHPVPGPLCNILGARGGGSIGIISNKVANHAGTGDPDVLRRVRAGIPPKSRPGPDQSGAGGGSGFIGIEWENNGTGEPWSAQMINTMIRVNAALCDIFGWDPATSVIGHLEWTTRKIDPAFKTPAMTMSDFRKLVVDCSAGISPEQPKEWDEMATKKEIDDVVKAHTDVLETKIEELETKLDSLAYGPAYAGHTFEGLVKVLPKIYGHVAGPHGDEKLKLRQLVESIYNKVNK